MKFIKSVLTAGLLLTALQANAAIYQYVPDAGSGISITDIKMDVRINGLWVDIPDNFTGRFMEDYGAQAKYGNNIPDDVLVGWIGHAEEYISFQYINPGKGINYSISYNNVVFWSEENYWDFVNGEIVNWNIYAYHYKYFEGIVISSDIGGRWVRVANPVPEPSAYAMLGLGLGVLGFAAARRKRQIS